MHQSPSMEDQKQIEEMQQTLGASKEKLAEDFKAMMEEASELAARAGQTQELMSRRLGDWMRETSKGGVYEDIQETQPLSPILPLHLEKMLRTSETVRFRLSVITSTSTAAPPGPYPS